MTPGQFQARLKNGTLPPATLLLGPEAYERRRIKVTARYQQYRAARKSRSCQRLAWFAARYPLAMKGALIFASILLYLVAIEGQG